MAEGPKKRICEWRTQPTSTHLTLEELDDQCLALHSERNELFFKYLDENNFEWAKHLLDTRQVSPNALHPVYKESALTLILTRKKWEDVQYEWTMILLDHPMTIVESYHKDLPILLYCKYRHTVDYICTHGRFKDAYSTATRIAESDCVFDFGWPSLLNRSDVVVDNVLHAKLSSRLGSRWVYLTHPKSMGRNVPLWFNKVECCVIYSVRKVIVRPRQLYCMFNKRIPLDIWTLIMKHVVFQDVSDAKLKYLLTKCPESVDLSSTELLWMGGVYSEEGVEALKRRNKM